MRLVLEQTLTAPKDDFYLVVPPGGAHFAVREAEAISIYRQGPSGYAEVGGLALGEAKGVALHPREDLVLLRYGDRIELRAFSGGLRAVRRVDGVLADKYGELRCAAFDAEGTLWGSFEDGDRSSAVLFNVSVGGLATRGGVSWQGLEAGAYDLLAHPSQPMVCVVGYHGDEGEVATVVEKQGHTPQVVSHFQVGVKAPIPPAVVGFCGPEEGRIATVGVSSAEIFDGKSGAALSRVASGDTEFFSDAAACVSGRLLVPAMHRDDGSIRVVVFSGIGLSRRHELLWDPAGQRADEVTDLGLVRLSDERIIALGSKRMGVFSVVL
ncbi:MAG: hypothetical protein JRH20_18750 [Deltaproteobacteria bacterium]|nr:hypothetical protein [Deltaproteobacteria bacterium]